MFDNLERAMQSAQRATDVKGVADGLTMILKQFDDTLGARRHHQGRHGGLACSIRGVHEAIQQVRPTSTPPGTVVAEVQPGYMHGERLDPRGAWCVVAKPKAEGEPERSGGDADGRAEVARTARRWRHGSWAKVIGIDLGTTNSCVAVVETHAERRRST